MLSSENVGIAFEVSALLSDQREDVLFFQHALVIALAKCAEQLRRLLQRRRIEVPTDSSPSVFGDWMMVSLRGDWEAGGRTYRGGSLLVMAIIGGAVLTPLMGLISEAAHGIAWAYSVPLFAFIYIAFYSFMGSKPRAGGLLT